MDAQTVGEEATQASGCGRGDACRKAAAARRREGVESDLGNRERERGSRQGAGEAAHRTNSSLSSQQMATGTRAKTTAEWRKPPGPHIIMPAWVRCMSWHFDLECRVVYLIQSVLPLESHTEGRPRCPIALVQHQHRLARVCRLAHPLRTQARFAPLHVRRPVPGLSLYCFVVRHDGLRQSVDVHQPVSVC